VSIVRVGREESLVDSVVHLVCFFAREAEFAVFHPVQRLVLTGLVNLSFYCRALSFASSTKLVSLFERCVKLHRGEWTKPLVQFFANILQYQSQGNSKLLYCMLRAKTSFAAMHVGCFETL
jgi:hypothetical protein